MASEGDIELWDIDIDQNSAHGHLENWNLAVYTWDPVGLVATRKAELVETRRASVPNSSGDNDSGGSYHNMEPGMDVEPSQDGGAFCLDPETLASAPVYHPQASGSKTMICQVVDCGVSLEGMKGYFLRHRVCEEHSKAPLLIIGGAPSRLCQQCSKFHHVSAFEGSKRTCRVQLDRIRINKRIRRCRKMNAAASAALAASGLQENGEAVTLGELPARPATAAFGIGGGRAKRPADSSGSGEGSWVYSRKSSRHGGAGVSGGARDGGGGRVTGGEAATMIAAAAAAATAAAGMPCELEPLPESGASDTGSREHPRASLGVSGSMRWISQNHPMPPRSPAVAATAGAACFGDGGSGGAALAHSPASAMTGGSHGAAMEYGSCGGGGVGGGGINSSVSNLQHHQQQAQVQHTLAQHRMARLDSLPMSAAEAGGSIAAAAAGLTNESSLTATLRSYQPLAGAGLASLAAPQDAATAGGQCHFLAGAAATAVAPGGAATADFISNGGATQNHHMPQAGQACPSRVDITAGLQRPSSGQDSGGSDGVAMATQEITSLWNTTAAIADFSDVQRRPSSQLKTDGAAALDVGVPPLSASALQLHPLLQQQLQQELLLQHQQHKLQQQLQQQQQHASAGLAAESRPCGASASLGETPGSGCSLADSLTAQQCVTHPAGPEQQQQQQQGSSWDTAAAAAVPMQLQAQAQQPSSRAFAEAAMLAAVVRVPELAAAAAAAAATGAHQAASAAQPAVAASQLSGPSSLTGRSAPGGAKQRIGSHCGGVGAGGGTHPSGGTNTNTLSSSKLVRMSLENDEALDDSSVLLGSLIDLLHTQAAEPRDGPTADLRAAAWAANASRLAPSTLSEPGSHGSGNGSLAIAAAASNGIGFGSGLALAGANGAGLATALGGLASGADLSSTVALSRAGSGAAGSPQNVALLTAAAAAVAASGSSLLGQGQGQSLESVLGVGGMPGTLAAATGSGRLGLGLLGGGGGGGGLTSVFGGGGIAAATAAAGGGHRLRDGLSPAELTAQLQEQAVLRASAHHHPLTATTNQELLLQHQLLVAQQQQQQQLELLQQQQQLLRLQQQAQAATVFGSGGAAQPVPAAGLLLSRLLDADTKTHHLSTELSGYLAEKQLLRRQLLATLSTCQAADPEQLAAAAMAAAGTSAAGGAANAAAAALQPSAVPGLGSQLSSLQRLSALGAGAAGLGAAAGLGLGGGATAAGLNAGGLGGLSGYTAAGPLLDATGGLGAGALGLAAAGLRPGNGVLGAGLASAALDMPSHMFQIGGVGGLLMSATGPVAASLAPSGAGLLGLGRPSGAAQLQALAEGRAAAAAGAVGATAAAAAGGACGGPSSSSFEAPDVLTRVSLKIMNCLPDELPNDIRSRMQAFASQAPLDLVQGCLRPGCTEVVLDALHCGNEQWLVSELLRGGDSEAAAAALLAALPAPLHAKDIYLQAADQVVCLRPGAPPRHASWAAMGIRRGGLRVAKPELAAAESLVLQLDSAMDMESCIRMRVYGKHLADPGVTVLARLAGLALPVTIRPVAAPAADATPPGTTTTSQAPAQAPDVPPGSPSVFPASPSLSPSPALPYEAFDVEIQMPHNAPPQGLLILEPRAGVLLGSWAPVLVLQDDDGGVVAEVEGLLRELEPDAARRLAASLGVLVDHVERCAAVLEAQEWERGRERRSSAMEQVPEEEEEEEGGHEHDLGAQEEEEEEEDTEEGVGSRAGVESPPCPWVELFGGAHRRVVRMGHTLLAYAALRSCPRLMSYLGAQLVEMGEPLGALLTAAYNGVELLGCALLSGCGPGLSIAAAWAAKGGAAVSWRARVPGQPAGVTLLHLAASLPLHLAVPALDTLWALAVSGKQPASAADAFAAAWFADDGADDGSCGFDAPAVLFRASIDGAVIGGAATHPADASAALAALLAADTLDRMCLRRLAAAYIRVHSFTSPLDNVELPSLEGNSCVALSVGSGSGGAEKNNNKNNISNDIMRGPKGAAPSKQAVRADHDADGVHDLDLDLDLGEAAAVSMLRSSRAACSAGLPRGAPSGGDRSGHGSVGSPPGPCGPFAASGGWAAVLEAAMGDAPHTPAPQQQQQRQSHQVVSAAVAASPPRMRVSVAPKALAQTAAAAAAASGRAADGGGGSSWLAGGGSGADASCVPPSGTTNASTTIFASGSLPAFSSGAPYGSSMASYYSQVAAAAAAPAGACKPPLGPLVDMFRPLPESPSSGLQLNDNANNSNSNHNSNHGSSGAILLARATNSGGGGGGALWQDGRGAEEARRRSGTGLGGLEEEEGDGGAGLLLRRRRSAAGESGRGFAEAEEAQANLSAGVAECGSGRAGAAEAEAEAGAAAASELLGSEKLRGSMRGLARMFRRLFKKGAAQGAGPME